jgi:excisionase family DNA binding protein
MRQPDGQQSEPPVKQFLSPAEFAVLSGLSLATVHRYLRRGTLPFQQPGGKRARILISRAALDGLQLAASPEKAIEPQLSSPAIHPQSKFPGPRPRWKG